uniref:Uncharacterized protein n=1 Tax=Romanomermis culicivorax TaxID=13658 RepID=A0A915L4E4_ROMCU
MNKEQGVQKANIEEIVFVTSSLIVQISTAPFSTLLDPLKALLPTTHQLTTKTLTCWQAWAKP